ncbi:hypothetical protein BC332_11228 [Capsicum chinense]|nr:hypothetical protein BC332_11228 [Capsicum chinense]
MSSGKGTKTNHPGVSRSSAANCLVITLFTPVSPQKTMGKINLLALELFFVAGVVPGEEIKYVVVAEEYITALRNTRSAAVTAVHWKSGHKRCCLPSSISQDASEPSNNRTLRKVQEVASNGLWPEYEIAITDECEDKVSDDNGQVNSLISSSRVDESIEALMDSFGGEDDKKSWASFQERISRTPEQVLRYYRDAGAKPLWPTSSGQPSKADIPKCTDCGGRRTFEFQVLPQILYYFGVENDAHSLDWATIAVYTCESSCDGNVAYKEEFAWVQIASQYSTTQR